MVRLGQQKRQRLGVEGLALTVADTLCLPFRDETFHAVTVAFGIRNLESLRRGLGEMLRVLRPGGQVVILEFSLPATPWIRRSFEAYFNEILPRLGGWLSRSSSGREAYSYLPRSVADFPDPRELALTLEECGFDHVHHIPFTFGIANLHLAKRPRGTDLRAPKLIQEVDAH